MSLQRTLIFIILLFLVLTGCSEDTSQQPIRLGTNVWPGYEPLYLGRHLGFIDPQSVRLIEYPSASEVIRAFRNRSIDAAALTLDEALLLQHDSIPVSVILVMDVSNGGDVIVARKEITSMKDLKGKRVAVESGALGAYVISRALEIHGMELSDIDIKHLEVSSHEASYRKKEVDAAVTFEPVRTQLLNLGAHELFSSRDMPGEIVDVLVVHNSLLEQSHTLKVLIDGWFAALNHLENYSQNAAEIIAMRLKITPAEVLLSYAGLDLPTREENKQMLGHDGPLTSTVERLSTAMRAKGLLNGDNPDATLIYDRIVR